MVAYQQYLAAARQLPLGASYPETWSSSEYCSGVA
jgi:hypothetical protein